jgi:hypothetical protein
MCVQVTKIANRFEISSLLENILLKQVRWCLTFVGLYIMTFFETCTLRILRHQIVFKSIYILEKQQLDRRFGCQSWNF